MEENTTSGKGVNPAFIITAVVIVLLIGVGVVMLQRGQKNSDNTIVNQGESTDQTTQPSSETTGAITPTSEITTEGDIKTITIEAGSFYYKPSEIKVKKGDKVKVVMNSVSMMHDFNIDELNVKIPVTQSGKTGTVEFTADKIGTYEFYCSVGNHRQMGQIGTLIVE